MSDFIVGQESGLMDVEVAYALPDNQLIISLSVPNDSNVEQVIKASGIMQRYPQIDLEKDKIGIFSKVCKLDKIMKPGDRVEIYRSLIVDPKEKRRRRAEQTAKKKKIS